MTPGGKGDARPELSPDERPRRVYLRTFGCRANQYDSEVVRALVESSGGEIVATPDDADAAVFNSCAVTAAAEAELRQSVRRAARRRPSLRTVVMGCAAARDTGAIAGLPSVTAVLAGADLPGVAMALGLPASAPVPNVQTGTRALLRIQDGCDEHCTFCATTLARGAARSREASALVDEAARLAERHPEIVVTGIHIGHYGVDTGDAGNSLARLVARLVREVPRVRFRLSSLEATEVDDQLLELFGERGRLAPHLHAPLQSGSERVLKRMGRHWYTAASYGRAVERLASRVSGLALGADVIAGFPGESDEDHRATTALLRALPFTYLHVFPYSPRPGTAAERLSGSVSPAVAGQRARELRAMGDTAEAEHRARRLGQTCDLVVMGGSPRREGLTEDYLTVDVDPSIPRGTRWRATLAGDPAQLLGVPHEPIIRA
ncbi:MAG: tRNA ((6)-L-threonylcarbamoyladenosine(37)-C(2))-methylthiotransferase MtaB [Geminicoccaceae bacterium]|nr:tRNA ((6)-L-threonylcarbamoyladenosine(37)-C(2))-methylthiotransferase MtaB [Geminicoccaceae bacterium]